MKDLNNLILGTNSEAIGKAQVQRKLKEYDIPSQEEYDSAYDKPATQYDGLPSYESEIEYPVTLHEVRTCYLAIHTANGVPLTTNKGYYMLRIKDVDTDEVINNAVDNITITEKQLNIILKIYQRLMIDTGKAANMFIPTTPTDILRTIQAMAKEGYESPIKYSLEGSYVKIHFPDNK